MIVMTNMPIGNTHIAQAKDENGAVIGVTISLLVMRDEFYALPDMFRHNALRVYEGENKPQS